MADQKLSSLVELAAAPATNDELYIRDVSEAAAAESKRITTANLLSSLPATTLGGTVTINEQVFDAGALSAQIITTGNYQGLDIKASHASHGPRISLYHTHTTPEANLAVASIAFHGFDAVAVAMRMGMFSLYYDNVGDGTERTRFEWWGVTGGIADNVCARLYGDGVLDVDTDSGLGAATVGKYDSVIQKYGVDDVSLLDKVVTEEDMGYLVALGIMTPRVREDGTPTYMVNLRDGLFLSWGAARANRVKINGIEERLIRAGI